MDQIQIENAMANRLKKELEHEKVVLEERKSVSAYLKKYLLGDQCQGKSGRIREYQSPVFKSGEIRENGPFSEKIMEHQGIALWIKEKLRELKPG